MFKHEELERAVELQRKSWGLLRWCNRALRSGRLSSTEAHQAMSMADTATAWLKRNRRELPEEFRPTLEDLPAFARFFASYLKTSYRLTNRKRVADCGCWCEFCAYLTAALVPRKPAKKAFAVARGLKIILLRRLADEMRLPYLEADLYELLDAPETPQKAVSTAAYGQELLRRTEFASQGEGVLVLWRETAWGRDGRVRDDFELSADLLLDAEKQVQDALAMHYKHEGE